MDKGSRVESLSFREVFAVGAASSLSSLPLAVSASARFLVFGLCVLKMDDLILDGRVRATVVEAEVELEVWARRDESWLVNAMEDSVWISFARVLGRGMP